MNKVLDDLIPIKKEVETANKKWYLIKIQPYRTTKNKIEGVVVSFIDITEQKTAQIELNRKQEQINETAKLAKIGGWEINAETGKQHWTEELFNIFEFNKHEEPSVEQGVNLYHPDCIPTIKEAVNNALNKGEEFEHTLKYRTMRGKEGWAYIIGKVEKKDGKIKRVKGTFQDITHIKELEIRLKEQMKKLEDSNKELQYFAHFVAHEIKNPLNIFLSAFRIIKRRYEEEIGPQDKEMIETAKERIKDMMNLINEMLKFSNIDGDNNYNEKIDLNNLVKDIKLDLIELIKSKKAWIKYENLPEIIGNMHLIKVLLKNLISNGIKYNNSNSSPIIIIKAESREKDWIISVEDNGIGINEEEQKKIFHMMYRIKNSKIESTGNGIGLAISRRIVEAHNGNIWVESEPDKGTTFYFTIQKK